jgi:hypothetical protein
VTKTRSSDVAIEVIRLKSPMTVRSSGRQSRLPDCASSDEARPSRTTKEKDRIVAM